MRLRQRAPSSRSCWLSRCWNELCRAIGPSDNGECDLAGCELKKVVTHDAKRKEVAHFVDVHQMRQLRVCSALNMDRSTVRYQSRRDDDTELRIAMKVVTKRPEPQVGVWSDNTS